MCTFGAGGAGQLGHNSTQNELTPRVVAELWGARVSQVACGRWESTNNVPSKVEVLRESLKNSRGGSHQDVQIPVP